tara:strand:+ start:3023 stop:3223 length:201 start_codon:yes stop_codon:yes gene_type:complete
MKLYFVRDLNYEQCMIFVKKRDAKDFSKSEGLPEPEEHNYPVTKKGMLDAMEDAAGLAGNYVGVQE